jgi:hypothetical protein
MKNLLKTLAVVCICLIQLTMYAQIDASDFNTEKIGQTNYKTELMNVYVLPNNGLQIIYENPSGLPNYFQFAANSYENTSLTIQILVTDNNKVQTITRDIEILDEAAFYEVPIHQYLTPAMSGNPDAVIKSVTFKNSSNTKVMLRETVFAVTSKNYPVGINQVFVLDKTSINKRYYIHSKYERPVNVNIYDVKGTLMKREKLTLGTGDNYIGTELLEELIPAKYTIIVSDALNSNIASKMTVMF